MKRADSDTASPGKIALQRILHHPPTFIALLVFGLITLACWMIPPFWPHSAEDIRLSLGASPPMATLYALSPEESSSSGGTRHLTRQRALRLAANGDNILQGQGFSQEEIEPGLSITWVEIPLIVRTEDDAPIPPAWIPPEQLESYFSKIASLLPGGVESLPGKPESFAQTFVVGQSGLLFPAGTDELGRDLLVRILEGGRLSIAVGFAATLVSVTLGVLYGGISGYCGGRTDAVLMRIVDILYALPFLIFVILLMAIFPRSLMLLFLAIGAVEWLTTARIVRGEVLALRQLPFIDAAHGLGLSHWKILRHHLLPNTMPPVIVYATLTIPTVILLESVLSFLGLGVQPPNSSWGVLISEGADRMETYPWMLLFPSKKAADTLCRRP